MTRMIWMVLLWIPLVLGCHRSAQDGAKGPKPQVQLPAKPDLQQKPLAERYPDGALSVEGFFKKAQELNGQEVTVRGTVLETDLCAPEAPCTKIPSVTLVDDTKNPRRRLTVVGATTAQDLSDLKPSSTQTLTGKAAMWSPDGRLIQMDGMLVLNPPAASSEETAPARP